MFNLIAPPLITPPPVPYPTRYIIDPVAFFAALIGGPVLFTALTFWALFIPVFALVIGGPIYLIIGTPVLLWYLRHHDSDPSDLGFLAFVVTAVGAIFGGGIVIAFNDEELLLGGLYLTFFALIFGPAWAYTFGRIYTHLRRDFFAKPRKL
jgi:hypothetical protein